MKGQGTVSIFLISIFTLFFSFFTWASLPAPKEFRWSANLVVHNEKQQTLELKGNATFRKDVRRVKADYIVVDWSKGVVNAIGNCTYSDTLEHQPVKATQLSFQISNKAWTRILESR